jgi:hypothetical protein
LAEPGVEALEFAAGGGAGELAVFVLVDPDFEGVEFGTGELAVVIQVAGGELGGGDGLIAGVEEDGGFIDNDRGVVVGGALAVVEGTNRVEAGPDVGVVAGVDVEVEARRGVGRWGAALRSCWVTQSVRSCQ